MLHSHLCNAMCAKYLSRGAADEEPLVNGAVNLLRREVLVRRQRRQLVGANAGRRVLDSQVGARELLVWAQRFVTETSTYMETSPGLVLPVMRRSQASPHSRTTSIA